MTTTARDAVAAAAARLAAAGVASPRADAEALAAHVLGVTRAELARVMLLGAAALPPVFDDLVARRAQRVPLQHLVGRAAFRHVELAVGPGVFTPRPETEVAAGLAVDEARRLDDPVVVDLCTGSAAIAVSVAVEVPAARVVALELSEDALAWAARNVAALAPGVDLRAGDVAGCADDGGPLADLAGGVDVVVANPPYIPDGMVPTEREVLDHDPAAALWGGGADGLDVPRAVVAAAARLLRPGGLLVMEHAAVQGPSTRALAAAPRWTDVSTRPDLAGRDRVLIARRAAAEPAVGDSPS